MESNKNYGKLYLRVLQIGQKSLGYGLSFNKLRKELENEGYDFKNDCIELAVKHWFFDSFFHVTDDNDKPPCDSIENMEHHLNCNFMLKGEHCLKLVQNTTSKNALKVSSTALVIALLGIGLSIYNSYLNSKRLELYDKSYISHTQQPSTPQKIAPMQYAPLDLHQIDSSTQITILDTLEYVISLHKKN